MNYFDPLKLKRQWIQLFRHVANNFLMKCNILIKQIEPSHRSFQLLDRCEPEFPLDCRRCRPLKQTKENFCCEAACVDRVAFGFNKI